MSLERNALVAKGTFMLYAGECCPKMKENSRKMKLFAGSVTTVSSHLRIIECQSRLVQFGFRRLTKEEIQQKTTDRAALYNPVAVKEKQDALREASKVKAEEAAAAKADAARYLNMKR